jgi:hypothetical protein
MKDLVHGVGGGIKKGNQLIGWGATTCEIFSL